MILVVIAQTVVHVHFSNEILLQRKSNLAGTIGIGVLLDIFGTGYIHGDIIRIISGTIRVVVNEFSDLENKENHFYFGTNDLELKFYLLHWKSTAERFQRE
jgi:hypothetical protein